MMNREEVVALMKSSDSPQAWNANVAKVREAYGGGYPDFWAEAIWKSGLGDKVMRQFGPMFTVDIGPIR